MAKPSVAIKVQPHSWTEEEFKQAYRRFVIVSMQRGILTEAETMDFIFAIEVLATAA
jgi:hypothetical protein